jgi:hypothetical protein
MQEWMVEKFISQKQLRWQNESRLVHVIHGWVEPIQVVNVLVLGRIFEQFTRESAHEQTTEARTNDHHAGIFTAFNIEIP